MSVGKEGVKRRVTVVPPAWHGGDASDSNSAPSGMSPRMELIWPAACFALFLAIYAVLQRRAHRPVQWGWIAAIAGCAAAALLIGALMR